MEVTTEIERITVEMAQELLGWKVVTDKGATFHFRDVERNRILCSNNLTNRPLYKANYDRLKQEILKSRWYMNGEPIIIGDEESILNGQHTLIALVLAGQEYEKDPELWEQFWDVEPWIEKVVITGIEESDEVINTLDTCRPRSFADCIFRSDYFEDIKKVATKKKISKAVDFAVRLLWHRTGVFKDHHGTKRTHPEAMSLIERHPRLLEAVRFIFEEDEDGEHYLSRFLARGTLSGMHYLMCTSASSDAEYFPGREEASLNFSNQDSAEAFWIELKNPKGELSSLRKLLSGLGGQGDADRIERLALICKAWELWIDEREVTTEALKLEYTRDDYGNKVVAENHSVGGIDLGNEVEIDDYIPEDLEQRARAEKVKSLKRKRAKK